MDLSAIPEGQGVVFGSFDVRWPNMPGLAKLNPRGKIVHVYSERKLQQKHAGDPDRVYRPTQDQELPFLEQLPAGRYVATCLYLQDLFGQPSGRCYPVGLIFEVVPGQVTYVGRWLLKMPSGLTSVSLDASAVDDRAAAVAALPGAPGEALAAAESRLALPMRGADTLEMATENFARLLQAMQDQTRVHHEERADVHLQLTRFVIEGRSPTDWDTALEIVQTMRYDEPRTPAAWLDRFRQQSDPQCPSEWQVLAEDADSVLFERRSPECAPHVAQQALYRTIYGPVGVWLLICTQKGALDAPTRRECQALLESAKVSRR
ncbi:MAG: hypothetical protein JSR54_04400 [Proteobacteria bacterium]|nr:hypothetical protein [Pseudomonadota bacterium]